MDSNDQRLICTHIAFWTMPWTLMRPPRSNIRSKLNPSTNTCSRIIYERGKQATSLVEAEASKGKVLEDIMLFRMILRPPPDQFFHSELYASRFGDPSEAKNKRNGHQTIELHGFQGVFVPGTKVALLSWLFSICMCVFATGVVV